EARDDDDPARDVLCWGVAQEVQRGDLTLVLVAVIAAEHQHRGAIPSGQAAGAHPQAGPAAGVRRARNPEVADLLAGALEVEIGGDRSGCRHVDPFVDVAETYRTSLWSRPGRRAATAARSVPVSRLFRRSHY